MHSNTSISSTQHECSVCGAVNSHNFVGSPDSCNLCDYTTSSSGEENGCDVLGHIWESNGELVHSCVRPGGCGRVESHTNTSIGSTQHLCVFCGAVNPHNFVGSPNSCNFCDYTTSSSGGEDTCNHSRTSAYLEQPTCTTPGKIGGEFCLECGEELEAPTIIPALGHDMLPATCTEPSKCQRTGCTYTEGTALGHDMLPATCTEPSKCQRTGCTYTEGAALGHDMLPATCTEPAKCQRAGCTYTEGAALGHDMLPATCTEPAKCQRTGCTYTEGTALGHDYEVKNNEEEHWQECTRCGDIQEREPHNYIDGVCECGKEEAIEKPECTHENKVWKSDEDEHWQECAECGEEIEGSREPHNYIDGVCECGKEEEILEDPECSHEHRIWKSNEDEHWQECEDCGKEIPGTRGEHVIVDGVCKNCGRNDETVSGGNIPNTGIRTIIIVAMTTVSLTGMGLGIFTMNKYKGI